MVAIVLDDLRTDFAKNFIDKVQRSSEDGESYYLFFARHRVWEDDSVPDLPVDSRAAYHAVFPEILAAMRISSEMVAHAIPRNNWESGTVYDIYRHDYDADNQTIEGESSLYDANFYVVNSELNVYKCIDNNNGAESTVEPTGTSTNIQTLGDEYRWKFMYGLTSLQALNFVAPDFLIVKTVDGDDGTGQLEVQEAAVDGAIDHIAVDSPGSGYSEGDTVIVTGTGSGCTAEVESVDSEGGILKVLVTESGEGYFYAEAEVDESSEGTGATLTPIIPPPGGHGANAVYELGGHNVYINVTVTGAEGDGDFPINNDFRVLGIVHNLKNKDGEIASNETLDFTNALTLSDVSGNILAEDTFEGQDSNAQGRVLTYESGDQVLRYTQTVDQRKNDFQEGEIVQFDSGSTATIDSIEERDVQEFSGYPLYIENRRPIVRTSDQQEDISIILTL